MFRIYCKLLKHLIFSLLVYVFFLEAVHGGTWREIKPFRGADITVLFRTPSQKILAGSLSGYLYSSEDGGRTWKTLYNFNSQRFSGSVNHICADPSGVIFVNTTAERGIQRSTDDGLTWNQCKAISAAAEPVFSLSCDKNNNLFAGRQDGLFMSKDKGETWTKILSPGTKTYFRVISFLNNSIYTAADKLYVSSDGGKSWTAKNLPTGAIIQSLLLFSENEMMLMASFPAPLPFAKPGIFHSTDGGTSWKQIADGSALNTQSKLKEYNGKLYLTSYLGRIYVSSDKGISWDLITGNQTATNISDILFSNTLLLAGAYGGGILRSEDFGSAWQLSNEGLPKIRNRALIRREDGSLIIANDAGIYLYNTAANEYSSLNFTNGSISSIVDMHLMADKSIIAANYSGGILKSVDNGGTWRLVSTPWEVSGLQFFKKGPGDNIYIYSGSPLGLYKYSSSKNNWDFVSSDFPYAGSVCFDGSTSYVSSHQSIFRSDDSCKTWNQLFSFIAPVDKINVLKPGYLMIFTLGEGIKYSSDSGNTWKINNEAPLDRVRCFDAAALNDNKLIIAADKGLLESSDSGLSWSFNKEFENVNISKIVKSTDGSYVYLLTGNGIFELNSTALTVKENNAASDFSLYQNYPNPFNPVTTISYSIPAVSDVSLKVYDLLGCEVQTLVNEPKSSGSYSVRFDGSSLPSGFYIYTLQAGSYRDSKKFLLLK